MASDPKSDPLRLGFLTAVEVPDKGVSGGLLVTNRFGRPLEFQCTTPVKANSTQEILYGASLQPYLLGELIGGTLVEKASVKPQWILTDLPEILELRNHIDLPVVLVATTREEGGEKSMKLGRHLIHFHSAHTVDCSAIKTGAEQIPQDADLQEPFVRVREALRETLKSGALR